MYPGIGSDAERRLLGLLDPTITDLAAGSFDDCRFAIFAGDDAEARALGLTVQGELTVVVTDPDRPLGEVRIQCGGKNTVLFVDNRSWGANMYASIRVLGSGMSILEAATAAFCLLRLSINNTQLSRW